MPECWTETTVTIAGELAEAVGSFLLDLGSPGLVTEERAGTVTLTAFLATDATAQLAALQVFCDDLQAVAPAAAPARIATRPLPQSDWAQAWMEHFPPLAVGERLYIVPPWIRDVPADRTSIVIDPGLAFGTGHHATTQGCLILLERALCNRSIARALDLGTGSGILAIALAKLGVAEVEAIDVDAEACRAARDNCARNGVAQRVHIGTQFTGATRFNLIVANLLSSALIQLAPSLVAALAPAAHLIVSGILITEAASVGAAFAAHSVIEHSRIEAGEWVTLDLIAAP